MFNFHAEKYPVSMQYHWSLNVFFSLACTHILLASKARQVMLRQQANKLKARTVTGGRAVGRETVGFGHIQFSAHKPIVT